MSAHSGPYWKGYSRTRRAEKRQQAEARQRSALLAACLDGVCDCTLKYNHHVPKEDVA